jgi:hypothetical protein
VVPEKFTKAFLPTPRFPLLITLEKIVAVSPLKKILADLGT